VQGGLGDGAVVVMCLADNNAAAVALRFALLRSCA